MRVLAMACLLLAQDPPKPPPPPQATPAEKIRVREGFQVELLYSVPKAVQGSWVSMAVDPRGRLVVSDQDKLGLWRVTPKASDVEVEKIPVDLGGAQGLLWAFDALYVNVNGRGSGLWRVTDSDGDDRLDRTEQLIPLQGGGEHGPHAVVLTEDGKGLYVVAGNHTEVPELTGSRLPPNWKEDLLLPRQWDANGHARGRYAPGGYIFRTSPDGKERVMVSVGYRNEYDVALNRHGELFTFDSDMEWDLGSPWYRPTRVTHAVSGSEFGWRSGTGKWPTYYADSLPAVVDIGPASPTGVVSGIGAKFPARYQDAVYVLDWTYGTIWACHLKPKGASYEADVEEFLSGTPLPVTDAVVGRDGALYFAIGGRGTQSGLYRVTYTGRESTAPAPASEDAGSAARAQRRKLEVFHGRRDPAAVAAAWPLFSSPDRFLRYAARVAVESQPVADWQERALAEKDPQALALAMVALARQGKAAALPALLGALGRLELGKLPDPVLLDALRAYMLAFDRMGMPAEADRQAAIARLDAVYPSASRDVNRELCILLTFLQAPGVIGKTLKLMAEAGPTPAPKWVTVLDRNRGYGGVVERMSAKMPPLEKIQFAFTLRNLRFGWTPEQRRTYFQFLNEVEKGYSGGNSFPGFIRNIRKDALALCSAAEREALAAVLPKEAAPKVVEIPKPKGPGREWTTAELAGLAEKLEKRNYENGKRAYLAAQCAACHRFDGEGGDIGPDLTSVSGRFSARDLVEAIVEPSKVVSDQYQATILRTRDGTVVAGRIVGEQDGKVLVITDMLKPDQVTEVPKASIADQKPSAVSPMPEKLIHPLGPDEALDLVAYLLSAGNRRAAVYGR
jgi:putative heme-binding domain-containing protein